MPQIASRVFVCTCVLIILEQARALPLNMDQSVEDFKKEMLDALNAKRTELGFSDKFELAKEVSADEKALNDLGSHAKFCPRSFRDPTPQWIPIENFANSRPLSLQVDYWTSKDLSIRQRNADDFTPEWTDLMKQVTPARIVDYWASTTATPDFEKNKKEKSKLQREFGGDALYNAKSTSAGPWPFVTANADKNVVITRANCGHSEKQAAFVVLFPNYYKVEVPENERRKFAMDKTYELCKPTDEQKAKICDEKTLKSDNNKYVAYRAAIKDFAGCVSKKLFGVFALTGKYHTDMVAERLCGIADLFTKEAKGVLSTNQFQKALKSNYNPFFDFSQEG